MSRAKVVWESDQTLVAAQSLGASGTKQSLFDFFGKGYASVRMQLKVIFGVAAAGNVTLNVYPSCDAGVSFDHTAAFSKTVTGASGATRSESIDLTGIPYARIDVVNADAANAHNVQVKYAGRTWEE